MAKAKRNGLRTVSLIFGVIVAGITITATIWAMATKFERKIDAEDIDDIKEQVDANRRDIGDSAYKIRANKNSINGLMKSHAEMHEKLEDISNQLNKMNGRFDVLERLIIDGRHYRSPPH